MRNRSYILLLATATVAVVGCAPGWYEANADREVVRIVEQRKEQTLKYKPQTEAKTPKETGPTKRAYEKIPVTKIAPPTTAPLQPPVAEWVLQPLGPLEPPFVDERLDFVPPSYATAGLSMEPQGPPTPGSHRVVVDLMGAIEYAVSNARDYQDRMEDLYLSTLEVTLQRHLFEPRPFARTTFNYQGRERDEARNLFGNRYKSAYTVTQSAGIRQQLPYGGEIVAQQLVDLVDVVSDNAQDSQTAETSLSASIPLLRGAGLVNLEPLVNSERNLVYAVRSFEQYRRQFAVNIASRFFNLVLQQQSITNRRQNYQNLKILSERAMALFAASRPGTSYLDVQRAQQNLLNAENSLIDSVNQYQSSLDSFKIALGMPIDAELEIVPVEMQLNLPELDNVDLAEVATKYRLDLQTARDRIEDAQRGVKNAKNGLLPDVTLSGTTGYGNSPDSDFNVYSEDSINYRASVAVDWPIDQVSERNAYRRSLITLARAQRSYVTSRDQVIADVRNVVRAIRLAQVSVEIQRRSVELNQRRLELANERLLQGRAQVLDVVDAQSALLNAQDALDRARANLQTQVLNYLRDTGTLRLDPQAGAIARAMDRAAAQQRTRPNVDMVEQQMEKLERQ